MYYLVVMYKEAPDSTLKAKNNTGSDITGEIMEFTESISSTEG